MKRRSTFMLARKVIVNYFSAPEMKISKETFLETGETLSLKCLVLNLNSADVPPDLYWYRGNNTTPLDEIRGGVLVETDQLTLSSHLQVRVL